MQSTLAKKKVKRKPSKPKPRMCKWCWDIFYSAGPSATFCATTCREKYRYWTQREKRIEAVRISRDQNKEAINLRRRLAYQNNPEKREAVRRQNRENYLKNREERIAYANEYQKNNPQVAALTRQARKAAESYKITQRDHRRLLERYRHACAYCEVKLAPWGRAFPNSLQWDHVIPLSKGGTNSVGNILPTCRTCNRSKSARFLSDWLKISRLEEAPGNE